MTNSILFDPLLGWPLILMLVVLSALLVGLAIWRRLSGWALRGLAVAVLALALANPSLQRESRELLADIVIAVVDESASQGISDRGAQTADALAALQSQIAQRANTELKIVRLGNSDGDEGTALMSAVAGALAEEPKAQIAGIILLSDGRAHDVAAAPDLPAPMHLLLSGHDSDWDRRLTIRNAPAFAILGEPVLLTLRIEDQGDAPEVTAPVRLSIAIDGDTPLVFQVPIGEDIELPITLPHGGMNVLQFEVPEADGELTDRNNAAVVQINGVRDRLRVLLVSGEPHSGERTWRNLLKSDSSVDLVHFTILRPPEKQDGVPVDELSLIAFPTRELFLEKIDEFDLIIFDRYRRRGILPLSYFENIRAYVEKGGAVLIAAGPAFGGAESLYRSPLAAILPGAPTARVYEEGFLPQLTDLGRKHPVTEGLAGAGTPEEGANWGRWFRQVELDYVEGHTVMSGIDERPLLILNRVGQGRVALLASDHAWLWDRGFEGGGPQQELLRRLAHWMMKEPELEEEAIWADPNGLSLRIIRRTLGDGVGNVTVTAPDGSDTEVELQEITPGRFEAQFDAPEMGLYRLVEGDEFAVVALGPAAPKEFEETIATGELLAGVIAPGQGGIASLAAGMPNLREVRAGRPAAGRGWIGITPRGAYRTAEVTVIPALPPWAYLIFAAFLILGAWLREGRR